MSKAKIIDHRAQSKFICSKCGSARDCDCNAPAREREAARKEANRQASFGVPGGGVGRRGVTKPRLSVVG